MDNPTSTGMAAGQPLPRLKMKATLPNSGQEIVMSELTGQQEISAATEAGETDSVRGRAMHVWAQAMRGLVSIGGKPFDSSEHTPESFRSLFSAKDFGLVVELFMLANRPTDADVATFRESAKTTS